MRAAIRDAKTGQVSYVVDYDDTGQPARTRRVIRDQQQRIEMLMDVSPEEAFAGQVAPENRTGTRPCA